MHSLYLAWRYLWFHKGRSAVLIACVALIAVLPLALEMLVSQAEVQFLSRAQATPLLVGAKGSALDLVMNALYFDDELPELIHMDAAQRVDDIGLGYAIPLYARFEARGQRIVGTTLDYFEARGLRVEHGRLMGMLGECVLGARAAQRLGVGVGDSLVSSPETLFDLAGVYPLKMNIAGVLAPAHSPDDEAVFVDVKTAWVIEGLGHGHQDLARTQDSSVVLARNDGSVTANAKLVQYTEITADNMADFHFHGEPSVYPLTAVMVMPNDEKSAILLRGRYVTDIHSERVVQPVEVIDALLQNIFRLKRLLEAVVAVVGSATLLVLVLVFALSLRLRAGELQTNFLLGAGRSTTFRLVAAEISLVLLAGGVATAGLLFLVLRFEQPLIRALLL